MWHKCHTRAGMNLMGFAVKGHRHAAPSSRHTNSNVRRFIPNCRTLDMRIFLP